MNFLKKNKGQISSIDLLVSILFFVILFIALRNIWQENIVTVALESEQFQMQMYSNQALNVLLKTQGDPTNWNELSPNSINLIGISDSKDVINSTKLRAFTSLPYLTSSEKLGLNKYDFNFELYSTDNKVISYGANPDNNSITVSIKRFVMYNGGEALVIFKVFKS